MIELYINKKRVEKNPANAVTEEKLFKPRRCKDKDGNWRFHEDGIFSREIFGNIGTCFCGANSIENTWCKICNGRVVSKENMPDFYIPLDVEIPMINANYKAFGKKSSVVKSLINYRSFFYEGQVIEFDLEKLDIREFEDSKIKIGADAIKALKVLSDEEVDEWIIENTITDIPIPHPVFRPLISTNKSDWVLGDINKMLLELLKDRKAFLSHGKLVGVGKFHEMSLKNILCKNYEQTIDAIFKIITNGKKSIIKQEIISQSITGAIRAVLTNDHSLTEDEITIGYELVETLYPRIYKQTKGNIDEINRILREEDYYVLVNRPPTIGQKSIIGMKPIISKDPLKRFVIGTNSIIFDGLAGDTDGDVLLVIALYSKEANQEIKKLLPSNNYIGANDGKIRNKIPEDFMYTMKRLYEKGNPAKDKIQKAIYGKSYKQDESISPLEQYNRDVKAMENISRSKYINIFNAIGKLMWEHCVTPTVEDIAKFIDGEESEDFESITNFLGSREKLKELVLKEGHEYTQEESSKYISKVMSSNSTDISEAGWFYKKLISSADDLKIVDTDCGSVGKKISIVNLTEDDYNYRIRFSFVNELNDFATMQYPEFLKKIGKLETITIRTPATCNHANNRRFCEKCVGPIKLNHEESFIPENIGIFTTLMVTEHATQASLDSMNKGTNENLNVLIERPIKKNLTWDMVLEEIDTICEEIGWIGVQKRFYEISILSRFYRKNGLYIASSLQYSFRHHADSLGNFIYTSSKKNFLKLINERKVDLTSMKSKIMFDIYD